MKPSIQICCGLLIAASLISGCGWSPQVQPANRKILESLQTAVSAKKIEWVNAVVDQVVEKRSKKEISDAEFQAIDAIVKKAKAGDWKQAQKASFVLSDAQRPTSQDFAMLKNHGNANQTSPN